ncbi:MAG: hypothetical protein ACE15C_16130 [Phycisphaerae bacterium]
MAEPPEMPGASRKQQAVEMSVLALLAVIFLTASLVRQFLFRGPDGQLHFGSEDLFKSIGLILAAGLTLVMYSFLYRDNALFKVAENLYVGVTLGYGAILTWRQALRPDVYDPLFASPTWEAFWLAVLHRAAPIVLGILLVTRLSRKYGWLSRYAYAIMIGWGSGIGIPLTTHTYILQQLSAAVKPFQDSASSEAAKASMLSWQWLGGAALPVIGTVLVMVGTVAVLWYFFFSVAHKRVGGAFSRLGIWFLMVSFGASFGYTVMGRVSLLIGRVQFLLFDWLNLPK